MDKIKDWTKLKGWKVEQNNLDKILYLNFCAKVEEDSQDSRIWKPFYFFFQYQAPLQITCNALLCPRAASLSRGPHLDRRTAMAFCLNMGSFIDPWSYGKVSYHPHFKVHFTQLLHIRWTLQKKLRLWRFERQTKNSLWRDSHATKTTLFRWLQPPRWETVSKVDLCIAGQRKIVSFYCIIA